MADHGKLRREHELSANRQHWWPADHIDPELFGLARPRDRHCPMCGAKLAKGEFCLGCAGPAARAGLAPPVAARGPSPLRQERVLRAPEPLDDIASARSAGDILGVIRDGWLGLWSVGESKRVRTWDFEAGKSVRLAVADEGGCAVLAVTNPKLTRLYLVDFELRRLGELTDFDGAIQALGISPDGRQVAFVDDGPDVRVYQVEPWKKMNKFAVEGTRFAFGLAADRLAAADDRGRVFVWDLREAAVEWELMHERKEPACPRRPVRMAFTRSGGRLLVATGEVNDPPTRSRAQLERVTTLRSWDLKSGTVRNDLTGVVAVHPAGIADAYFGPSGAAVVTVGETNAHAWDLGAGEHLGPVYDVTEPAEVWEAQAARRSKNAPLIRRVEFSGDGEHALVLVAGSREIRVFRWSE
jgi:hypothetical protein